VDGMDGIQCLDETFLFSYTFEVLLFGPNVGVVVEDGYLEILGEVLQYITAARCTTTVEQQTWCLSALLNLSNDAV